MHHIRKISRSEERARLLEEYESRSSSPIYLTRLLPVGNQQDLSGLDDFADAIDDLPVVASAGARALILHLRMFYPSAVLYRVPVDPKELAAQTGLPPHEAWLVHRNNDAQQEFLARVNRKDDMTPRGVPVGVMQTSMASSKELEGWAGRR